MRAFLIAMLLAAPAAAREAQRGGCIVHPPAAPDRAVVSGACTLRAEADALVIEWDDFEADTVVPTADGTFAGASGPFRPSGISTAERACAMHDETQRDLCFHAGEEAARLARVGPEALLGEPIPEWETDPRLAVLDGHYKSPFARREPSCAPMDLSRTTLLLRDGRVYSADDTACRYAEAAPVGETGAFTVRTECFVARRSDGRAVFETGAPFIVMPVDPRPDAPRGGLAQMGGRSVALMPRC